MGTNFDLSDYKGIMVLIMESMSGADCVASLKIFSNQWHVPETIWSDNGTYFIWAAKVFRGRDGEVPTWKSNPPLAPRMVGVLERLVRSFKVTLEKLRMPAKSQIRSY